MPRRRKSEYYEVPEQADRLEEEESEEESYHDC